MKLYQKQRLKDYADVHSVGGPSAMTSGLSKLPNDSNSCTRFADLDGRNVKISDVRLCRQLLC